MLLAGSNSMLAWKNTPEDSYLRIFSRVMKEILKAENRIRPHIIETPLIRSQYLSDLCGGNIYLKLESEQHLGSFKSRGALSKILSLSESERCAGVVTASTGNHGLAVARAMKTLGVRGTIFLPYGADPEKVAQIKVYGGHIEFFGQSSLEAERLAKQVARERKMVWISPYNDYQVIGGQGTIALELTKQLSHFSHVLVTIGGGGLASGIAAYLRTVRPATKIIGCLPENSPEMFESVRLDKYVSFPPTETLSDGSAGGFEMGSVTFEICKRLIDDYILVSENEIRNAIRLMVDKHERVIEGAAAVSVASLIKRRDMFLNKDVVIVICGKNISAKKLEKIL